MEAELAAFAAGEIAPADFPHREHLRFAYELLARFSFGETLQHFERGLQHLAARAGKPQLYHQTITVAFLSLVAQRRAERPAPNWGAFIAANADLLDKDVLLRWYAPEELASDLARTVFCLPRPPAGAGEA